MKYRWREREQQERTFNRLFTHLQPPELLQCVLALVAQWTELLGMMGYEVDPWREWTDRQNLVPVVHVTYPCNVLHSLHITWNGEHATEKWKLTGSAVWTNWEPCQYQLPLSTPHVVLWCQLHSNRPKLQLKPAISLTTFELVSLNSILSKVLFCPLNWMLKWCEEVQCKPKDLRLSLIRHWYSLYTGFIDKLLIGPGEPDNK